MTDPIDHAAALTGAPPKPGFGLVGMWPDVVAASLAINLLSLALPLVVLQVYDRVLPNAATGTLTVLATFVAACLVGDVVLRLCRSHVTGWAGARFEHTMSTAAFARLLRSDPEAVRRVGTGAHFERFEAVATLRDFFSGQALLIAIDFPFALVFIGMIGLIAGPLALVPLGLALAFCAVALVLGTRLRRALDERRRVDDRRFNFVIEMLSGLHTVKGLGMEALMARRYERLLESAGAAGYRVNRASTLSQGVGALFMQVTTVAIVAAGAAMVLDGALTVGGLAACTLLAGRALQPLLRALGLWTQFQAIRVAKGRLEELLGLPSEQDCARTAPSPLAGRVELEAVRFGYPGQPEILRGIDLVIEPGETVAIAGEAGSGRSTLLGLIQGHRLPMSGSVRLDGVDTADVDRQGLRASIAYLPPSATLFDGTIIENLTMFRDGTAIDSARAIAGAMGLHEIVARLPRGYDTAVGGSNAALPGGVRQCIAVVRALVGKPRLVLYDEADSQLDRDGDAKLKAVLAGLKGTATLIIVSHRPSILALADRTYTLVDGRLELRAPSTGRLEQVAS